MAKLSLVKGTTSYIAQVFIQDSSSTTGAGLTGLVFNSGSMTAYYHRDTDTTATVMTLVTMTVGTWTSLGFKEIDATNMPGWYQLGIPNAALATGAKNVGIHLKGATNMAPLPIEIELTATDNQDAVRGGMTAMPNANAAASGGLPILGANATAISFTAGMVISNAGGDALQLTSSGSNGNALAAAANGTGAGIKTTGGATGNGIQAIGGGTSGDAILTSTTSGHGITAAGTGTTKHGINATGGATTSHGINATGGGIGHGILATSGGGSTGDGIKAVGASTNGNGLNLAGVGTGAGLLMTGGGTGIGLSAVGGGTSGDAIKAVTTNGHGLNLAPVGTSKHGLFATGGNGGTSDGISAVAGTGGVPIRGDQTGNITGNVSGSVGSVTGAVGSVTGAVGSVTGAVGSVTGAVGSVTGNVGGNVVGSVGSVTAGGIAAADKTGYRLSATGLTDIRDIQLLEVYAADGSAPTLNQAIMQIQQFLTERAISATTLTVKKLDGSTTAMTFMLDSATSPTSITRAT